MSLIKHLCIELLNFYREYVLAFAELVIPLCQLLG